VEVSALSSPVQKAGPASASNAGGASALSAIRSIRRDVLPDAIRITIEVESEVPFHEERIDNPSRIFVDFSSSRAVPALVDKTLRFDGDADPVHQIRIGRHPGNVTRVVLDAIGVSSYSVYALYKPYRLVIDCVREKTTMLAASAAKPAAPVARTVVARPPPLLRSRPLAVDFVFGLASVAPGGTSTLAAALAPAESPIADIATITSTPTPPAMTPLPAPERNMAGGLSLSRQRGLGVSKIVIDPGHGGHDPGATGNGVSEAELVLDVALRLEKLLQKLPDVEVILTPVGGGGLGSGIATVVKALRPEVKVIGVEPEDAAETAASLRDGQLTTWPVERTYRTIADGVRTAPSELTFAHLRERLDGIVTVTDAQIEATVGLLAREANIVAEPTGAVAPAAYLFAGADLPPGRTVAVVSGGNLEPALLAALITR